MVTTFPVFPSLSTSRLELSVITHVDAPDLQRLRGDTEVMRFIPRPLAQSLEDALQLVKDFDAILQRGEGITWGIHSKGEKKLIGTIAYLRTKPENFRSEVGYLLDKEYQGKGIMKEALEAVMDFGFHVMGLHSIEAVVDAENKSSIVLLEKCGFMKEGYLRDYQFYKGGFHNTLIYSRLR